MRILSILSCFTIIASFLLGCGEVEQLYLDDQITHTVDTLQVLFEIGEEFGDSTNTFWSIVAADIDDQGRIFVLDEIDASVKAYDLQGNFIQQVTRRGSGPGELLWPRGLTIMGDGSLVILAPMKKGYVVFNDSLEFVEEISLWEDNGPYHVSPLTSDKLVVCRYDENSTTDALRHTVAIYQWGEKYWETLLWKDSLVMSSNKCNLDPSVPLRFVLFHSLRTFGDGVGNAYFGLIDSLNYRVIRWDSAGTQTLNLTMDLSPVRKTPEEIAAEAVYMIATHQRLSGSPEEDLRPYPFRNMVSDVGIGMDGNLWVRRGTRADLFFDIYNLDGVLLRHVIYPLERWSWETEITPHGILAWELDPLEGYQKLYFIR